MNAKPNWVLFVASLVAAVALTVAVTLSVQRGDSDEPAQATTTTFLYYEFGYGEDPALDEYWDLCEEGVDDLEWCDRLFYAAPVGSEYERFGATCGYRASYKAGVCQDLALSIPKETSP